MGCIPTAGNDVVLSGEAEMRDHFATLHVQIRGGNSRTLHTDPLPLAHLELFEQCEIADSPHGPACLFAPPCRELMSSLLPALPCPLG
jgi:hypothetical protein